MAAPEALRVSPRIEAQTGLPVIAHEALVPVSVKERENETIYDFGQNFAPGVSIVPQFGQKETALSESDTVELKEVGCC